MNTSTNAQTVPTRTIHPATRLGHVHYTVANLDRQVAFYRDILGFKLHWQKDNAAGLGAGSEDLLRLTEQPGARTVEGTTGLYHTAFLVPTRRDLAYLLLSIAQTKTPIQGMTNHGTHHAIYLPDVEGNGIELAWDFPPEQWPKNFDEMMSRNRRLYPREVFEALEENPPAWDGLNTGTKVGHVHLHVSELPATDRFYGDILGMERPFVMDTAIFFAAGGYHHHIGTNVWQGVGAPPPPADTTGLRYYTMVLPDEAELNQLVEHLEKSGVTVTQTADGLRINDPAQNGIILTATP